MRLPKKKNLDHFLEPELLDEDITDLRAKFKEWETADGRGKTSVWTLLGKAYELGCAIADNGKARGILANIVSENPEVRKSNQWDPYKKPPFDLLVVLLLGLKEETKVTKSQWLRTLKAAEKAQVSATQDAFVDWVKKSGGIDGALKLGRSLGTARLSIHELATKLPYKGPEFGFRSKKSKNAEPVEFNSNKIAKTTLQCDGLALPEGFALILVQQSDEADKMWPIASVADERLITRAIKSVIAENKKEERAFRYSLSLDDKRELARMRQVARKEYRKGMKAKKNMLTYWPDFLYEYSSEHGDEWPDEFRHLFPIVSRSQKIENP